MLIGSRTASREPRASSQAASAQEYREVYTTDAVAGRASAAFGIGAGLAPPTPPRRPAPPGNTRRVHPRPAGGAARWVAWARGAPFPLPTPSGPQMAFLYLA